MEYDKDSFMLGYNFEKQAQSGSKSSLGFNTESIKTPTFNNYTQEADGGKVNWPAYNAGYDSIDKNWNKGFSQLSGKMMKSSSWYNPLTWPDHAMKAVYDYVPGAQGLTKWMGGVKDLPRATEELFKAKRGIEATKKEVDSQLAMSRPLLVAGNKARKKLQESSPEGTVLGGAKAQLGRLGGQVGRKLLHEGIEKATPYMMGMTALPMLTTLATSMFRGSGGPGGQQPRGQMPRNPMLRSGSQLAASRYKELPGYGN